MDKIIKTGTIGGRDVDDAGPIDPRVLRLCAVALELRECLAEECGGESGPFREILSISRDAVRAIVGETMPGMGVVVPDEEGPAK